MKFPKQFFFTFLFIGTFPLIAQNTFPVIGDVGIGTLSPTSLLDVRGAAKIRTLNITSTTLNDGNFLKAGVSVGGSNRLFNWGSSVVTNSVSNFTYDLNGNLRYSYFVNDTNHYLGLRDAGFNEIFKVGNESGIGVFIHMPKSDSRIIIGQYGSYLLSEGHSFINSSGSALFENDVFMDTNLGIGTDTFVDGTDTYRLSVKGKVRADAVKVYTDWADFVFEPGYKLPTLKEVEAHIEQFGHLKDIPSAKEVEANGIELGEMNKLLLQKIEELTLYIVDLNKRIEELENDK